MINPVTKQLLPLWPNVSRLKAYECKLVGDEWQSKGYGINSTVMLDMEGRLSIDVMMFVKKEYKLPKYSLNYVSGHFLDDHKDDMTAAQMFTAFEGVCEVQRSLDQGIPYSEIPHGKEALAQWGLVIKYAIQDAALVLRLYHHFELWNYLSETANITHINIIDTFTRGQQIRSFSLIYDYCYRYGYVLNRRDCPAESYKGGYVRDPIPGLHDRVIVLDFESLYPNVMRANNTCPTTLIRESDYEEVPLDQCNIIDFDEEEDVNAAANKEIKKYNEEITNSRNPRPLLPECKVTKHYHYRFYTGQVGLVPLIEGDLLRWRKAVKEQMKSAHGNYKRMLDARQLAIKVTCNSLYGFFGAGEIGIRPCLEVARSVTAQARRYIHQAFAYIETVYHGTILAADTDSAMFTIPVCTARNQCSYWGEIIAHQINGVTAGMAKPRLRPTDPLERYEKDIPGIFPSYIRFVHEKDMLVVYLCKKKYFAFFIKEDGSFKLGKDGREEILAKGNVLARRDNAPVLQEIYDRLARHILHHGNLVDGIYLLCDHLTRIFDGKFDYHQFATIKTLGANYRSDTYQMAVFRDFLYSVGKTVKPGDRLEYLIVVNPYATKLGQKMVLVEQYLEALGTPTPYQIDYSYYVDKMLKNPLNQLFALGFPAQLEYLNPEVSFKLGRWVNNRGISDIVEVLLKAREEGIEMFAVHRYIKEMDMKILGERGEVGCYRY